MEYSVGKLVIKEESGTMVLTLDDKELARLSLMDALIYGQFLSIVSQAALQRSRPSG